MRKALLVQIARENRLLLGVVLVTAAACAVLWWAQVRQHGLLLEQQRIWSEKRRQLAQRSSMNSADRYHREQRLIAEQLAAVPYRYEFPRVIANIQDRIQLHGAEPGAITYKSAKTTLPGMIAYTIQCSALGGYPGIKRLLAEMERLEGIAVLERVILSNPDPQFEKVRAELELTFYLQEPQP